MSYASDYQNAIQNDNQLRQRMTIAVSRIVIQTMQGTPTPDQIALAKRFFLNPESEVDRYLLPVAAQMSLSTASFTDDTALQTAVNTVLGINVTLKIA